MNARVFSLLLLLLAPCIALADTPPDVVILRELENEYAPVPFSHKAHADMAEMHLGCETCHHQQEDADDPRKIEACKSCHPIDAKGADIRVPSLKGAYHRQCLNCHKGWAGENGCAICHEPKNGVAAPEPTPGDIVGRMHPPIEPPDVKVYRARYTPAAGTHVTFRHDQHVSAYGIACVNCHFRDSCASCHDAENGQPPRKPVMPAMSWTQSHQPCLGCHQNQSCAHCHHDEDAAPPPTFDHLLTGQQLDDDHADLTCAQCHRAFDFAVDPTCGDAACHGETVVAFPTDRPGLVLDSLPPTPTWASLKPRPRRPGDMRDVALLAPPHEPGPHVPRRRDDVELPPMPVRRDASCVTEDCHVAVKAYPHVHGPIHVDACDACHLMVDEDEHQFAILREGDALCTYCHTFDVADMPMKHEPVERGECLGCHNPHGGATRSLTRGENEAALCARCHDPADHAMSFQHTPVRNGQCTACHAPHASRLSGLLDVSGSDLCTACHDAFGEQLAQAAHVHKAMDEQCTRCHDAHGSDQPLSLVAAAPGLCLDCHEDMEKKIAAADVTHATPVLTERACLTCHTPHGGDLAALMRQQPADLCMSCHEQDLPDLAEARHRHGPIAEGQCSGCHDAHGSAYRTLLTAPYEPAAHVDRTGEQTFCFQCHDRAIADAASATTGFRNGQTNLHAMHVSDVGEPRNCSTCHAIHRSAEPKLIRAAMRLKQWQAPIGFRATDTGGYCAPGCHAGLSYDRQNPVQFAVQYVTAPPRPRALDDAPPPLPREVDARIVRDAATRRVEWYAALAEELRTKGDPAQAALVLDEALKLHPDRAVLRLAMARTLIDLDKPADALGYLDNKGLSDDAALLRCAALIRLERWDDAQTAAADLPDIPEAHFLAGRIHEHFGRWREAAEAYRNARP